MGNANKFLKSSIIYFIGSVLTKGISFFLLPLYTNLISKADMGYYDLTVSYLNIIFPVICMEVWSGIMRFMYDSSEKEGKYRAVFNGLLLFTCSMLLYSLLFIGLGFFSDIRYLFLIYLFGLLTMIQNFYSYLVRGLGYSTVFAVSGLIGSLVNAGSNIIMILCLGMRLDSLYIAMILGLLVQIIIMECKVRLLKNISFKMFDKSILKGLAKFSLPLSLNSACFWFLSGYNRIGISNILGYEANGVYSVAAKFAFIISLVSSCFTMAWQELAYSKGNDADKGELYTAASNYYLQFLAVGLLLFLPAINVVFPFFIGPEFRSAFDFIPLYLLGTAASIFSSFLGNIFGAEKKTNIIFFSTVAAAAVNVGLFHLLVGNMGLQAANISLLCGFLVNIVMRLAFLNRSVRIRLNYWILAVTAVLFLAAWYVYLNFGALLNILFAIAVVFAAAFHFRSFLKMGWNTISKKLKKQ